MAETQARGYGWPHQRRRERMAKKVERGIECCARCGRLIKLGSDGKPEPWDLDHDDADRSRYLGASHRWCNRGHRPIASASRSIVSPNSQEW